PRPPRLPVRTPARAEVAANGLAGHRKRLGNVPDRPALPVQLGDTLVALQPALSPGEPGLLLRRGRGRLGWLGQGALPSPNLLRQCWLWLLGPFRRCSG